MNTNKTLSSFTVDTLQGFLQDSKTWVDFKIKCGLPKSRRQDGIRAYLDEHDLNYTHLTTKGQSGMQKKSSIWTIPKAEFQEHVQKAENWTDLLTLCGCEGFSNIGTIRRRIKELNLDTVHLQNSKVKKEALPDDIFVENLKVKKNILMQELLKIRESKCEKCENTMWMNYPIKLKLIRKNRNPFDNRQENLQLICPNCVGVCKLELKNNYTQN